MAQHIHRVLERCGRRDLRDAGDSHIGGLLIATRRLKLKVALVGGPMYDALYGRIPLFERRTGYRVKVGAKLIHPELNAHIARAYSDGVGDYDLIVTHNKYAPSQKQWLLPLNDHLSSD